MEKIVFFKKNEGDSIWWVRTHAYGIMEFSFDKQHIYNLFRDYPWELSSEEIEIFDQENPYWANFFEGRKKEGTPCNHPKT